MSRTIVALIVASATCLVAACGDGDASSSPAATADGGAVTIVADDLRFEPQRISASVGTLDITLDNRDDGVPHNIAVTGMGLDESTELEKGPVTQELSVELAEPGSYTYVCEIHPAMKGTIEVS